MRAFVRTVDGVYEVDLDEEVVLGASDAEVEPDAVELSLPRVVAASRSGATVIAVVDRRPPLVVSGDAGTTWREAGGGLPPGRAVAISEENPDYVVYAARNRLYVSRDGGRFWSSLAPEFPDISALAFD